MAAFKGLSLLLTCLLDGTVSCVLWSARVHCRETGRCSSDPSWASLPVLGKSRWCSWSQWDHSLVVEASLLEQAAAE